MDDDAGSMVVAAEYGVVLSYVLPIAVEREDLYTSIIASEINLAS